MEIFQNTLYLYSVLGAIHVLCCIMAVVAGVGFALVFGAWLSYKTEKEEDVETSNLFAKVFFWIVLAFIIFVAGSILIPSDSDLYIMYHEGVKQVSILMQ